MPHLHPPFKNSDIIKAQTFLFLLLLQEFLVFKIDQETLNLKLLDKSQSDDVSRKILYKTHRPMIGSRDIKIITIMTAIIGRITNTNQGTLNRRKKMVQMSHACNKYTLKSLDKRIINSLSCVLLRTKLYYIHYFSLIHVHCSRFISYIIQ